MTEYTITSHDGGPEMDPRDWELLGSNDGSAWTTLDTETNQIFAERLQTRHYPISNSTAYSYYRLQISSVNDPLNANSVQLGELELLGPRTSPSALPEPWVFNDVGNPLPGSADYNGGVFTVRGAGHDIWSQIDHFAYVSQDTSGDQTLVARITSQTNTDGWAKAGLMFRDTIFADSKHFMIGVTPDAGLEVQWRNDTGNSAVYYYPGRYVLPIYLKLSRAGNTYTAFTSTDGLNWTFAASQTFAMSGNYKAGLAVTSHNDVATSTALFDNVSLTSGVFALPAFAVEGGNTNLMPSHIATSTGYSVLAPSGVTFNNDVAYDPNGSMTAPYVNFDGDHSIFYSSVSVAPGWTYTFSTFVKDENRYGGGKMGLQVWDDTHAAEIVYENNTIQTLPDLSNWHRIYVTFTVPNGCTSITLSPDHVNGYSDLYLAWAKLEVGTMATPEWPVARSGDIKFDNKSQYYSSGGTVTIPHVTGSGPNRAVVVGVTLPSSVCQDISGKTITSVTYNGTALSRIVDAIPDAGTCFPGRIAMFVGTAPTSGNHDVVVTQSDSGQEMHVTVSTWENVDQSSPVRGSNTNTGNGGLASLTLSSAVGDVVVDHACNGNSFGWPMTVGQIPFAYNNFSAVNACDNSAASYAHGTANTTLSWYLPNSDWWMQAAVSLKKAN